MSSYKVAWKASTKTVQILAGATETPSGFTSLGVFDHTDGGPDAADPLGSGHNHSLFSHVKDLLYGIGFTNMAVVVVQNLITPAALAVPTPTTAQVPAKPEMAQAPTFKGRIRRGERLKIDRGIWSGSPLLTTTVLRDGVAIADTDRPYYVPVSADVGKSLTAQVVASNPAGSTTYTTAALGPILEPIVVTGYEPIPDADDTPAPTWSPNPSITGTAQRGQTLTGVDGTITNGTVSSRQWYRNGSAISGATNSTYVLVQADVGAVITFRVYATGPGGSANATSSGTSAVAALPIVAAFMDDFTANAGTMNGRTQGTPALVTYATFKDPAAAVGESVNSASVDLTGKGFVKGIDFNYNTHTHRVPDTVYDFAQYKILNNTLKLEAHLTTTGANLTCHRMSLSAINTVFSTMINAVAGNSTTLLRELTQAGDVIEHETYNSGGNDYIRWYINGRLFAPDDGGHWSNGAFNLTAAGITLTGRHGWVTSVPTANMDSFAGGNPATVSRMRAIQYGRVYRRNANGTVDWRVKIWYSGEAPTTVKFRRRLDSDNSLIDSGTLTSLVDDPTNKCVYGTLSNFTPAADTTKYWLELFRDDVVNANGEAAELIAKGPGMLFGEVLVRDGQSNAGGADDATLAGQAAIPNGFHMKTFGGVPEHRVSNMPIGVNRALAVYYNNSLATAGKPLNWITGGVGGQPLSVRGLGTASDLAIRRALEISGPPSAWHICDGNSDMADPATYKTGMHALYGDRRTRFGDAPIFIGPMLSDQTGNDPGNEQIRRAQGFELPALRAADSTTYPNYQCGPFSMDLQRFSDGSVADFQHFGNTVDGYAELLRREAKVRDFYHGLISIDYRGPEMTDVTWADANTIIVRVKLNGFTGLTAKNIGYAIAGKIDQFDCGLGFGTTVGSAGTHNTLTNFFHATGVSVGTPSGGFVDVTYTFTGSPFPDATSCYVRGPYGRYAFNAGNVQGIWANMWARASMLVGTISGENDVAIRPFWHASGNDYIRSHA